MEIVAVTKEMLSDYLVYVVVHVEACHTWVRAMLYDWVELWDYCG